MVQQNKRSKKRSPIRVNRKQDRSLKKEKKKKHNGGRTLKKNRNKDKKKFKDFIQRGGDGELFDHFQKNNIILGRTQQGINMINGGVSDAGSWMPFTYEKNDNKYITFYHKKTPVVVLQTNDISVRNDLYEMTNFYEFIDGESLFYDGFQWKTSEHYFQACKVLIADNLIHPNGFQYKDYGDGGRYLTFTHVQSQGGPGDAFSVARKYVENKQASLENVNWHGGSPLKLLNPPRKNMDNGDFQAKEINSLLTGQPATIKYQICLCIVYQKFRQNQNLRKILMNLTKDTNLIIVEDSRDNDDSWGNGYEAKRRADNPAWTKFKGNTIIPYQWTNTTRGQGNGKITFAPFNKRGHRNNVLGLILTSVGRLFNLMGTDINTDSHEKIEKIAQGWVQICKTLQIGELFSIFPWEHWLYGLHRSHIPLLEYDYARYTFYPNGVGKAPIINIVVENFIIGNKINKDSFIAHRYDDKKEEKSGPLLLFIPTPGATADIPYLPAERSKPLKDVLGLFLFLKEKKLGNYVYLFIKGGVVNADQLGEMIKIDDGETQDGYFKKMYAGFLFLRDFKLINTLINENYITLGTETLANKFDTHEGEYVSIGPGGSIDFPARENPDEDLSYHINNYLNSTTNGGHHIKFEIDVESKKLNFEIRLGDQAHSFRMPINNSDTGMIQVNITDDDPLKGNTRIVMLKELYDSLFTGSAHESGELDMIPELGLEVLEADGSKKSEAIKALAQPQAQLQFIKVPVYGYVYSKKSNALLAQKYKDVLFLFNDHLTDFKGQSNNAGIRYFNNAFGIPFGSYDNLISESYPNHTTSDITKKIQDSILGIKINYTVNSGNDFNRSSYQNISYSGLLDKLIENIKFLIQKYSYKAVVFNADDVGKFGVLAFSNQKGYHEKANEKMIELINKELTSDLKIINEDQIENELNKVTKNIFPEKYLIQPEQINPESGEGLGEVTEASTSAPATASVVAAPGSVVAGTETAMEFDCNDEDYKQKLEELNKKKIDPKEIDLVIERYKRKSQLVEEIIEGYTKHPKLQLQGPTAVAKPKAAAATAAATAAAAAALFAQAQAQSDAAAALVAQAQARSDAAAADAAQAEGAGRQTSGQAQELANMLAKAKEEAAAALVAQAQAQAEAEEAAQAAQAEEEAEKAAQAAQAEEEAVRSWTEDLAPDIPLVTKESIWIPPKGGNNDNFKCWLNAPLYSILQNEQVRAKITKEHQSISDEFIKTLYDLITNDIWTQATYLKVIEVFERMEKIPKYKLPDSRTLKLFDIMKDGKEDVDEINLIKEYKYYDAGQSLNFLENTLKKIGIEIYYVQSLPGFEQRKTFKKFDAEGYKETGKIWKNCVEVGSGTKLISLVQSLNVNVDQVDPKTNSLVVGEAGHFRSFIPIARKLGAHSSFNENYDWILVDAIGDFQKENKKPELAKESYSFYIFLKSITDLPIDLSIPTAQDAQVAIDTIKRRLTFKEVPGMKGVKKLYRGMSVDQIPVTADSCTSTLVAAPNTVTATDTANCALTGTTDFGVTAGTCADTNSAVAACAYVAGMPVDKIPKPQTNIAEWIKMPAGVWGKCPEIGNGLYTTKDLTGAIGYGASDAKGYPRIPFSIAEYDVSKFGDEIGTGIPKSMAGWKSADTCFAKEDSDSSFLWYRSEEGKPHKVNQIKFTEKGLKQNIPVIYHRIMGLVDANKLLEASGSNQITEFGGGGKNK